MYERGRWREDITMKRDVVWCFSVEWARDNPHSAPQVVMIKINRVASATRQSTLGTASDHVIITVRSVGIQRSTTTTNTPNTWISNRYRITEPTGGSVSTNFHSGCGQLDILTHVSINVRTSIVATWPPNAMRLETDHLDQNLRTVIHERCECQRRYPSFRLSLDLSLLERGIKGQRFTCSGSTALLAPAPQRPDTDTHW
jgi:hypothetical protein